MTDDVKEVMRQEWNNRAQKDPHFYVAFGQVNQSLEDFFASASDVLPGLQTEFTRIPPSPGPRRALEIGCGPGRLMRGMGQDFDEVHGVDISDEMLALARNNLQGVPGIHLHQTRNSDLSMFPDNWFDFVYSYVVFQHIPSKDVVIHYVREARRVLKPGGVLRCQFRGIPPLATELQGRETSTWTGCYFLENEVFHLSSDLKFPLVAIEGIGTQYLWATFLKRDFLGSVDMNKIRCKDVTATSGGDRAMPARGSKAAVSLWLEGLPEGTGLADLHIHFANTSKAGCFLSNIDADGGSQLNCRLPEQTAPGYVQVGLTFQGQPVPGVFTIEVVPAPARNPRIIQMVDGVNLKLRNRIQMGAAKVRVEDVEEPGQITFSIDDSQPIQGALECIEPIDSTYEVTLDLGHWLKPGPHTIVATVCGRQTNTINFTVEPLTAS